MTKLEMFKESIKEIDKSIDDLQCELDRGYDKFIYFSWCDAQDMKKEMVQQYERLYATTIVD